MDGLQDAGTRAGEWIRQQLRSWRQDLVNLNRTNRLLYFRASRSTLEIVDPAAGDLLGSLVGGGGFTIVEPPEGESAGAPPARALGQGEAEALNARRLREIRTDAADRTRLLATLIQLERRATQEFMDRGLWTLYLGVGMLEWLSEENGERERVESPLLLVPVTLQRSKPKRPFVLSRAEEDITINPALAAKLDQDFGISLAGIEDPDDEEVGRGGIFEVVRRRAQARVQEQPGWTVSARVVLGIFSFHKEVMFRDLLMNEESILESLLIRALALKPNESGVDLGFEPIPEEQLDEQAPPEEMLTILDADASQRRCIAAARDGHSFVMDGPPGTGKSQTIANLIAELLARGQSVLFVSEKAAALDVVYGRLEKAGIADFAFSLHSNKTTRRKVAEELGRCLKNAPVPPRALDALQIERLIARRRELSDYASAVNEVRLPLGRSLFQVLGRVAQLHTLAAAPHPERVGRALDAAALVGLLESARALSRAWAPVERGEGFLWRDLVDTRLDAVRRRKLAVNLATAEDAVREAARLSAELGAGLGLAWTATSADADRLVALLRHLALRRPVPPEWLTKPSLDGVERRAKELQAWTLEARALAGRLTALAGSRWARLAGESDGAVIDEAAGELARLVPDWKVGQELGHEALAERVEFLQGSAPRLRLAAEKAGRIARAFGLPEFRGSLARMGELANLGELAGSPTPPDGRWLDAPSLASAEQAAGVLKEHVTAYLRWREALAEVYTEAVLALDVERLCARFETVHKGWRKALPAQWRDRRTLASCARAGRAGREVIGRLREALEWKKAKERLEAAERRYAPVLGQYYEGAATDFVALDAALAVARRALELVGFELNRGELQRQLTRQGGGDASVVPLARELVASVEGWLREARGCLDDLSIADIARRPLEAAATIFEKGSALLRTVSEVVARAGAVAGRNLPVGMVREVLRLQEEFTRVRARLEAEPGGDAALLGADYTWLDVDWDELLAALAWLRRLREILGDGSLATIDEELSRRLFGTEASAEPLEGALGRWRSARDTVAVEFNDSYRKVMVARLESGFRPAQEVLGGLRSSMDDVSTWDAFANARAALGDAGLGQAVDFLVEEKVKAEEVEGVVERAVLERWADEVMRSDSRLQHLRPEDREDLRADFQELDRAFVRAAGGRVIESCNSRRPRTDAGAAGIILFEARKLRRHMPVARLLRETQAVVQAIKPCFMMSPLTVSQFLPAGMQFDVVIFDEASQVRPADAMNCIYRGRHLIVAGDPKQLPPTSFFDAIGQDGDDEWDEEEIADFESVLDLCQAHGLPSMTLRWHYRSQHEDLITFSNYSFYDGRLLTFPGAQETGPDLGVELFRVAGVYRRGGARNNVEEARKVVERVLFHALHHPALSLGVVAFSEAQATAIRDAVEAQISEQPELRATLRQEDRLRGLFVKNLETVQGDERDILIFSIGFGPDENGKFTKQLGPLSRKGGERRLNVAVTRARRRVEVISSVGAEDFGGDLGSDGARHLRRYLDYAARQERKVRALALDVATAGGDLESPFEEEVWRVIRGWGYEVAAQVGCAGYRVDLAVRHPERPGAFALGVECDGAAYHSSPVARDRDRLRQQVLEGLGWRLHRVWGPSWYRSRGEQESRLRRAIEAAVAAPLPVSHGNVEAATTVAVGQVVAVALDALPQWAVPYRAARPGPPRAGAPMHEAPALADLCRMIDEVVDVEGPVCQAVVLRRVREAWGVQRAGVRIREAFEGAVGQLIRSGRVAQDEAEVLSANDGRKERERGVRIATDDPLTRREVQEVPAGELALAVELLVSDARSISSEELTARVARLFGWSRRGGEIVRALGEAIRSRVREGTVVGEGGMLRAGSRSNG